MAIKKLNLYLWIRIYNGFDIIPDLRQTGITKNLTTFGLIYLQKELDSYLSDFSKIAPQIYRYFIKEIQKKDNNSFKITF